MERSEITNDQLKSLLKAITPIVLEKGPSHTTMDHVASQLCISKRTLYEIFGSKDDMLRKVINFLHEESRHKAEEIFRSTPNMMEAMIKLINMHIETLDKIRPDFFKDMDERCKHLRPDYDSRNDEMNRHISLITARGVKQGMFRKNCDYDMTLRLLRIQIESIKRMENYFPPEISIAQAFKAIGQSFLRNIATPEGIEMLEQIENCNNKNI